MKQLLVPILSDEVEYVGYTPDSFKNYVKTFLPEWADKWTDCLHPSSAGYCYPQYFQWLVNEQLRAGKVMIGSDGDHWIFTDPKNC
jgi:hypothetical protein